MLHHNGLIQSTDMKHFLFFAALLLVSFTATSAARAQTSPSPVDETTLLGYYEQWTPDQWRGLQRQILTSLRAPAGSIDQNVLQNVIFFETHFPEAMDLDRAAPRLLKIYESHTDQGIRILALSALHSVAEAQSMQRLAHLIRFEESRLVRHIGTAAVVDYYRNQEAN